MSAATALIIIADSRLRDPYFAFYELVPGMAIGDAALRGDRRVRAAIIRRFGYGVILGGALAAAGADRTIDAVAAGLSVTGLLLWPMVIHGVPRGHLRSDWMLVVVYCAVLAAYVSSVLAGQMFFVLVAKRDLVSWFRDEGLGFLVAVVLVAIVFGIFDQWLPAQAHSDETN